MVLLLVFGAITSEERRGVMEWGSRKTELFWRGKSKIRAIANEIRQRDGAGRSSESRATGETKSTRFWHTTEQGTLPRSQAGGRYPDRTRCKMNRKR